MKKSFDQGALVASAVIGRPLAEIAEAAGVSVSTAQRKLKSPEIAAMIDTANAVRLTELLVTLGNGTPAAAAEMVAQINDENPAVRLRASKAVIEVFLKTMATHGLAFRLVALQQPIEDDL